MIGLALGWGCITDSLEHGSGGRKGLCWVYMSVLITHQPRFLGDYAPSEISSEL